MDAVVLVGGQGTRLRPVLPDLPKPMAPIAGVPFLHLLCQFLARNQFTRIILASGYKSEIIQSYFKERFLGVEILHSIEETPMGTGGAVRLATKLIRSDFFFVFNGDSFIEIDILRVSSQFRINRKPLLISRFVDDASRFDCLKLVNGRAVGFSREGQNYPDLLMRECMSSLLVYPNRCRC